MRKNIRVEASELTILRLPAHVVHGQGAPATSRKTGPTGQPFVERPFVGRTAVISQLAATLDVAAAGQGRLFLLSGEAGIGTVSVQPARRSLQHSKGS